jgi:hypothetical protein
MDCKHENFFSSVAVNRLIDSGAFVCDIRVRCAECQQEFEFPDLPLGLSSKEARVSWDRRELRLPIKPAGQDKFPSFCGVEGFDIFRLRKVQ